MSSYHLGMSSRQWKKRRMEVLERDGWRCVLCGWEPPGGANPLRGKRLEIDHIQALKDGGANDLANLRTLCGHSADACHTFKSSLDPLAAATSRRGWDALIEGLG